MTFSTELPSSWTRCRLGDVVNYGSTDKAEPSEIGADDWILELEDIEKDTSRVLQRSTFRDRQSKSTKNRFQAGDVLYGKLRPYLNKVIHADAAGFCTTEIVPLRPSPNINSRYLFHWLKHPDFTSYVNSVSHGLSMPRLGTDAGRKAPFVLAPLNEQQRVADKLDVLFARLSACRDRLGRVPSLLKQFRKAVLSAATCGELTAEWRMLNPLPAGTAKQEVQQRLNVRRASSPQNRKFKEPVAADLAHWQVNPPETWSVESVSAFAECLDHLRIPVTKSRRSSSEGLYPYYGANGQVDMVDEFLFDDELVLVTEDETFYGREKPIAYRTSGRCWVNNHAHVLLAGEKNRADYLCYALMFYNVIPWLTGTTGRAKLTQGVLNSLPIAMPPEVELVEIVQRVKALLELADRVEARYAVAAVRVDQLASTLLTKAFRGELVPQDPNDEPATSLLDRITSAKETPRSSPKGVPSLGRSDLKTTSSQKLTDIITQIPRSSFTFDDLRQAAAGDYESIKDELFALLSDERSGVEQFFDVDAKSMRLRRVRK